MKKSNFVSHCYNSTVARTSAFFVAMICQIAEAQAALNPVDLTQDTSGGKTVATVATNISNTAQTGASLLIQLCALFGFCVVAISLYALWKASKDEREKPMSAIAGLFIGGTMAGVSTVMWIMKNSTIG